MKGRSRTLPAVLATVIAAAGMALTSTRAPAAHVWETVEPMPTARSGLAAATAPDGRIYTMGGATSTRGDHSKALEVYDPSTNIWKSSERDEVASMPTRRTKLAAATGPCPGAVERSCIYAIGGFRSVGDFKVVEAYDPANNTWKSSERGEVAPLSTHRSGLAATTAACPRRTTAQCIYAIGGASDVQVEAYDPNANSWEAVAPTVAPRANLAAVTGLDGAIYAIGGSNLALGTYKSVERYDPALGVWSEVAPMSEARSDHAAARAPDGRIYATGGWDPSCGRASVEVYNPASNDWGPVPAMSAARSQHAAATAGDGRIYAMGGICGHTLLSATEAYSPAGHDTSTTTQPTTTTTTSPVTTTTQPTTTTTQPTSDGPPVLADNDQPNQALAFNPMTIPTSGAPVRIYGSGFGGVTSVRFGLIEADFSVINSNIVFVQAPPNTNNTFVTVTVTDDQGSDSNPSFYYSNATASISPNSNLVNGSSVTFTMTGNRPFAGPAAIAQASPLIGYAFPRPTALPPPYVDPKTAPTEQADVLGNYSREFTVSAEPYFNADSDPEATCPPKQDHADHGLPACLLAWSELGRGAFGAEIGLVGNPTPSAPTLVLERNGASVGEGVNVSGQHWSANPNFGSSGATARPPGQTELTVEVCNSDAAACVPAPADASVRYVLYEVGVANGFEGTLTGATLSGSFTVPEVDCLQCLVRVRQFRPDGSFIEATAPLSVGQDTTTTTTAPTTTTTTTQPTTTTTAPTTTTTTSTAPTTTTTAPTTTTGRVVADFDGDGDSDISLFRPANGGWYISGLTTTFFGLNGDYPVPADYDGAVGWERAVFRPSNGGWYRPGQATVYFGRNGDLPVPADYNNDSKADLAVFRPSNGGWYIAGQPTTFFGVQGDIPVPADYDKDGDADIAVFRPSNGAWYVQGQPTVFFGRQGDIPVPADYSGDGKVDLGVFRPSNGAWYISGKPATAFFGVSGDVPVPGDYDKDGDADLAVFRPSNGGWYRQGQNNVFFGRQGDIPLPLPYAVYRTFFVP